MAIRALFEICEARSYSLALRLEPRGQGFVLSIGAGRPDGAHPRWEKRFAAGTRYEEEANEVAGSLVTYFTATNWLATSRRLIAGRANRRPPQAFAWTRPFADS